MDFEQEISRLQDTLVVMAEIQRLQADLQRIQAERIIATEEGMKLHEQRMNHIELNLSEITDKLNGLIGFMDGYFRKE
jgi:DNA repair exonuclease SbcCD ATPase subunit